MSCYSKKPEGYELRPDDAPKGCGGMKLIYNPYKDNIEKFHNPYPYNQNKTLQKKMPRKSVDDDTKWIGNVMNTIPKRMLTRFMLQNCNGLERTTDKNYFKAHITAILIKGVQRKLL